MQHYWNLSPLEQDQIREAPASTQIVKDNPCVAEFGPYPYDIGKTKCKNCTQIVQLYAAQTIYKCLLRGITGKTTDHRKSWPACAKFEERTEGSIPFLNKRG